MQSHDTTLAWRRSRCGICHTSFEWLPTLDRSRSICDDCRESDAVKAIDQAASDRVDGLVLRQGLSWDDAILAIKAEQGKRATQSWSRIRKRIFTRDGGICQVCGIDCSAYWECGHIIDRMLGGSDLDENLVVMCWDCNHTKPFHETREAYDAWIANGAPPIDE